MQVILLERIEKLGQMGQVVNVKAGYARNYLLPKKKALRATKENLGYFETRRVELEATNLKRKSEAQTVAEKMDGLVITLIRQASEVGHLYGSVRAADVAQGLKEVGYQVSRTQIQIDVPIKFLGVHQVRVLLHPEVIIKININVAQSEEEAAVQAAAKDKPVESVESAETVFGSNSEKAPKKKAAGEKKSKAKSNSAESAESTESAEAEAPELSV
jgi:large subunit ribosomal protein L9